MNCDNCKANVLIAMYIEPDEKLCSSCIAEKFKENKILKKERDELDADNERLRKHNCKLLFDNERLLYIAGQLGMLKRETDKFKELWREFSEMKYPEMRKEVSE